MKVIVSCAEILNFMVVNFSLYNTGLHDKIKVCKLLYATQTQNTYTVLYHLETICLHGYIFHMYGDHTQYSVEHSGGKEVLLRYQGQKSLGECGELLGLLAVCLTESPYIWNELIWQTMFSYTVTLVWQVKRLHLPVNAACNLFQSMLISEIMHSKALETTHWCVLKRYSCQLPQWVSLSFYTSRLFNKMLVSCSPFMGHEKKCFYDGVLRTSSGVSQPE